MKKIYSYFVLFTKSIIAYLINFSFKQINTKNKFFIYNDIQRKKDNYFVAFIERASHPINFNYVEYFLYIKLISNGKDTIIVVLPESDIKKIYSKDNVVPSSNQLRFDTILKDLIEIIEDFNPSLFYCSRRIDALDFFNFPPKQKFPSDSEYEKINYKPFYVSDLNKKIKEKGFRPLIKAPKAQLELIENIISKKYENKKIISISIRMIEDLKNKNNYRNSNMKTWLDVADWIKNETEFHPLIIPDLNQLSTKENFRGHDIFTLATYNLKIRAALYEKAYMNLSISCGFSEILYQSNSNYLVFKFGDRRIDSVHANSISKNQNTYGIKENEQFNFAGEKQKIFWGEETETFEFIKDKVKKYCKINT